MPSGELHSLTKLYFDNRRKVYTSKRQPFVDMTSNSSSTSSQNQHPTCHFIHYKSNHRRGKLIELDPHTLTKIVAHKNNVF